MFDVGAYFGTILKWVQTIILIGMLAVLAWAVVDNIVLSIKLLLRRVKR